MFPILFIFQLPLGETAVAVSLLIQDTALDTCSVLNFMRKALPLIVVKHCARTLELYISTCRVCRR